MMLELPGLLGLAAMSSIARMALRDLEQEDVMIGMTSESAGVDPLTGVFEESHLRNSLEIELSRSRRFGRSFAFVLVGIDEKRQRFDYRDESIWQASFAATAELLRGTRNNVDRVYRYGPAGFALVLPESGPKEVNGLVKRLRRVARKANPQEGEPGGPLPAHYGATFYPTCATTVDDIIRRAEIALRISDGNASRVQIDGAEAPEMPPVETMRQAGAGASEIVVPETTSRPEVRVQESVPTVPALRLVESVAEDEEDLVSGPEHTIEEAAEEVALPLVQEEEIPKPILAFEESTEEPDLAAYEPTQLYAVEEEPVETIQAPNYSTDAEAIEVDEEPPIEVFAYRAPEPAIDVYNRDWQTEAPLSVIRRPRLETGIVEMATSTQTPQPRVEDAVLNDALKQLDDTLELIRSLKKRSA